MGHKSQRQQHKRKVSLSEPDPAMQEPALCAVYMPGSQTTKPASVPLFPSDSPISASEAQIVKATDLL